MFLFKEYSNWKKKTLRKKFSNIYQIVKMFCVVFFMETLK